MFFKMTAFTILAASLALSATASHAGSKRMGSFIGASNHITTGGVSIVKTQNGLAVKLESDFSLDGAPDPKIGFGVDGRYVDGTLIGVLASNTGEQLYPIPAGMDVSQFNEVYIWCEKFSVPLGVAELR